MLLLLPLLRTLSLLQAAQENAVCVSLVVSQFHFRHVYIWTNYDSLLKNVFFHNITTSTIKEFQQVNTSPNIFVYSVTTKNIFDVFKKPIDQHGKYILTMTSVTREEIDMIMSTFWSHEIYDIIVIFNKTIYRSVEATCYSKLMTTETWKCDENLTYFPQTTNERCPLRINWVPKEPYFIGNNPDGGMEYLLLLIISQKMKKETVWYKEESKGYFENGKWTGALGNISDMAVGGFIMTDNLYRNFLLTYPHFYDSYIWYVPFLSLRKTIDPLSYSNHLLIYVYVSMCFCTMSKNDKTYSSPTKCALNILRIGLGQPIRKTPKQTHLKILFISWVIFQMHSTIIYSGFLIQELTKTEVDAPADMSSEKICCMTRNIEYSRPEDRIHIHGCNLTDLAGKMNKFKNFTILAGEEQMNFIMNKSKIIVRRYGRRYLGRYHTFVLPKNSEHYTQMNKIIGQLIESGIYMKIHKEVYYKYRKEYSKKNVETDLKLIYFILLFGWGYSLLVFIVEIIVHRAQIVTK